MATMTPEQWGILFEPKLRKVFFQTYKEIEEQFSKVFKTEKSEKREETDFHAAELGIWDKHGDSVDYEDFEPGDEVTYRHETFSKGVLIPFELAEDDQYNVIGPRGAGTKRTQNLARGARARVEQDSADVLNDGFTVNGYDGVPLFSDAHPTIKGADQSNLITTKFSEDALKEARLKMRKQLTEAELKMSAIGKKLVVPAAGEYDALVVTQTTAKTGSDHNDKNVVGSMIESVVVMDYLDEGSGTDDYKWFLMDPNLHEMTFFWRVKPEFFNDQSIDRFILKYTGRMRFSVGYSNWRGIVGSNATV